jgi:hypothetical protein
VRNGVERVAARHYRSSFVGHAIVVRGRGGIKRPAGY